MEKLFSTPVLMQNKLLSTANHNGLRIPMVGRKIGKEKEEKRKGKEIIIICI